VIRKVAGAFLIAIPFALMFLALAVDEGIVAALAVVGAALFLAGLLFAGVFLIAGKD